MDEVKDTSERTVRILRIMKEVNMNATQFSEAIGIQRAAMSHIMSGRNNPSADVIAKIAERFETINPGWLLTGKGNMKLTSENTANNTNTTVNHTYTDISGNEKSNYESVRRTNTVVNSARELNLFDQDDEPTASPSINDPIFNNVKGTKILAEENISAEISFTDENHSGKAVNTPQNTSECIEKEIIIYKERPVKTINKLLIFYSDNTYETFIPEKN